MARQKLEYHHKISFFKTDVPQTLLVLILDAFMIFVIRSNSELDQTQLRYIYLIVRFNTNSYLQIISSITVNVH